MSDVSSGTYRVRVQDIDHIRQVVLSFLERNRYKMKRKRRTGRGFRFDAIRGNQLLGILATPIPILQAFFGRTRTVVTSNESLNEGDHDLYVNICCYAVREFTDERETFIATQGLEEYLGDNHRTRQAFRALSKHLIDEGLVVRIPRGSVPTP